MLRYGTQTVRGTYIACIDKHLHEDIEGKLTDRQLQATYTARQCSRDCKAGHGAYQKTPVGFGPPPPGRGKVFEGIHWLELVTADVLHRPEHPLHTQSLRGAWMPLADCLCLRPHGSIQLQAPPLVRARASCVRLLPRGSPVSPPPRSHLNDCGHALIRAATCRSALHQV